MQNVLADLAIESEAATIAAMRLARSYDEATAGSEQAQWLKRIANAVLKYWLCKRGPMHAVEALECFGGNGFVEESGMPRLYRESPLNSIWEGSGNVQCLDVLRAMVRGPESIDAFFAEVDEGAGRRSQARRGGRRASAPSLATWRRSSRARGAWSSGWRSSFRARSSSATAIRRSPTHSAPRGSAATGGRRSARCRPAPTSGASSSATRCSPKQ